MLGRVPVFFLLCTYVVALITHKGQLLEPNTQWLAPGVSYGEDERHPQMFMTMSVGLGLVEVPTYLPTHLPSGKAGAGEDVKEVIGKMQYPSGIAGRKVNNLYDIVAEGDNTWKFTFTGATEEVSKVFVSNPNNPVPTVFLHGGFLAEKSNLDGWAIKGIYYPGYLKVKGVIQDDKTTKIIFLPGVKTYDIGGMTGDAHASERIGESCAKSLLAVTLAMTAAAQATMDNDFVKAIYHASQTKGDCMQGREPLRWWMLSQIESAFFGTPFQDYPSFIRKTDAGMDAPCRNGEGMTCHEHAMKYLQTGEVPTEYFNMICKDYAGKGNPDWEVQVGHILCGSGMCSASQCAGNAATQSDSAAPQNVAASYLEPSLPSSPSIPGAGTKDAFLSVSGGDIQPVNVPNLFSIVATDEPDTYTFTFYIEEKVIGYHEREHGVQKAGPISRTFKVPLGGKQAAPVTLVGGFLDDDSYNQGKTDVEGNYYPAYLEVATTDDKAPLKYVYLPGVKSYDAGGMTGDPHASERISSACAKMNTAITLAMIAAARATGDIDFVREIERETDKLSDCLHGRVALKKWMLSQVLVTFWPENLQYTYREFLATEPHLTKTPCYDKSTTCHDHADLWVKGVLESQLPDQYWKKICSDFKQNDNREWESKVEKFLCNKDSPVCVEGECAAEAAKDFVEEESAGGSFNPDDSNVWNDGVTVYHAKDFPQNFVPAYLDTRLPSGSDPGRQGEDTKLAFEKIAQSIEFPLGPISVNNLFYTSAVIDGKWDFAFDMKEAGKGYGGDTEQKGAINKEFNPAEDINGVNGYEDMELVGGFLDDSSNLEGVTEDGIYYPAYVRVKGGMIGSRTRIIVLPGIKSYDAAGMTGDPHASERIGPACARANTAITFAMIAAARITHDPELVTQIWKETDKIIDCLHGRKHLRNWMAAQVFAAFFEGFDRQTYRAYLSTMRETVTGRPCHREDLYGKDGGCHAHGVSYALDGKLPAQYYDKVCADFGKHEDAVWEDQSRVFLCEVNDGEGKCTPDQCDRLPRDDGDGTRSSRFLDGTIKIEEIKEEYPAGRVPAYLEKDLTPRNKGQEGFSTIAAFQSVEGTRIAPVDIPNVYRIEDTKEGSLRFIFDMREVAAGYVGGEAKPYSAYHEKEFVPAKVVEEVMLHGGLLEDGSNMYGMEEEGIYYPAYLTVKGGNMGDKVRIIALPGTMTYDAGGMSGDPHASERIGGACSRANTAITLAMVAAARAVQDLEFVIRIWQKTDELLGCLHGREPLRDWMLDQVWAAFFGMKRMTYREFIEQKGGAFHKPCYAVDEFPGKRCHDHAKFYVQHGMQPPEYYQKICSSEWEKTYHIEGLWQQQAKDYMCSGVCTDSDKCHRYLNPTEVQDMKQIEERERTAATAYQAVAVVEDLEKEALG